MLDVDTTSRTNGRKRPAPVIHLSVAERVAQGKAARAAVPRSAVAEFDRAPSSIDPVGLLEQQATTRVAELVPIRYGRMLTSPFAFFRGAALIMASDLAATPRSGLTVQACGDAHMSNFGTFGSPERSLLFDVNDFDETLPGPWEWDLKRLAASLTVAGRERGFSAKQRATVVRAAAEGYRNQMRLLAGKSNLEVWYSRIDVDKALVDLHKTMTSGEQKRTAKTLAKARTRDSMQAFAKLTHLVDGEPRIISDPPLIVPIEELADDMAEAELNELLRVYRRTLQTDRRRLLEQFRLVHVARKVVGVGSVGTRAWIALLLGRDNADPLFLQVKEAQASVLEGFARKSTFSNQGERVVAGQHLMQAASDIFLGWIRVEGLDGVRRDFYFRQLRDWKGSIDPETMIPDGMARYAQVCGWTLARAHARSGDRIAIDAYLGSSDAFDQALAAFAETYADQNELDYDALRRAVKDGRLTAITGV